MQLLYRPCVGLMIIKPDGTIFSGLRIDNQAECWQMPQGGIDEGETPEQALFRELNEETGITSDHVEVLAQTVWMKYNLPPELATKLWGGIYAGQEQKWFALRFIGTDADIDIHTKIPEFREWAWLTKKKIMDHVVPFKKEIYDRVFLHFNELIT